MVTQIWTLQICIVIFSFKFNLKFSVKLINEQYIKYLSLISF